MLESDDKKVIIIGGGPAGLTAAYELCKTEVESIVLEKDKVVGGLSRTVNYKGYLFDIGGHRFFTKVKAVDDMWREVLPEGKFLRRPRLSRIFYKRKFFYYPLRAINALMGLGILNSILILLSYIKAQLFPQKPEESFEQWISNRFGKRLFNTFFKTYTEKVWGIPCSEIRAEWAAQRIKGLSLISAIKNALIQKQSKSKGDVIKTLIDEFEYPEQGPGMMWETVADIIQQNGSQIRLEADVEKIHWVDGKVVALEASFLGQQEVFTGTHFISSMPIRELLQKMHPPVSEAVLNAASSLNYRDFLTVAVIINKRDLFPDNWIYIHDEAVKVGRIQNFKNWSPHMVPDPNKTCVGLEYFCFEGDGLWTMTDQDLIELAKKEMEMLGLAKISDIEDGSVVRMPKAYPVYDSVYGDALDVVRQFLSQLDNLQLVGRNGMHKYNNQDHAMLTAMLAVKNIMGANYDLWKVNADQEYHEEINHDGNEELDQYALLASTQPKVPLRRSAGV
jgi:protoporphyrinogen oxidase